MAVTIEERGRLEGPDETWERANHSPTRPLAPPTPDVLDRIGAGIKAGIRSAVKSAVWAMRTVALAIVVVFFVLPYTLTALAVAGGAILVRRILRYCRGPGPSTSTGVAGGIRGGQH